MKKSYLKHLYLSIVIIVICLALNANAGRLWPPITQALAKKSSYNLAESKIFPKVLMYTEKNYVEPKRINPKEMLKSSLNDIQRTVPEILITFSSPTAFSVTIDNTKKNFSSPLNNLGQLWEVIRRVFEFVQLNYKGDVELKDIESVAIDGALKALDPHSALFTPEFYKEFKIDTGGQFGGLGIVITSKDGQLTVIAPIEGTPAWKAGLKSNDVITQINDESTINMSLMKAVERLRGKVGTKVTVTIERKGRPAPFEIKLTRAKIQIDSVKSTLIKDEEGNVGYIKIKRFQKGTASDFIKDLKKLQTDAGPKFKGLILDFRNNPGGLLDQAVKIADLFLDTGVIVSTVGARKKFIEEDVAHLKGTEPKDYPIIVLVNEGSASASEIVAGALQVLNRALVMGQKTFGKGSVQSVYELGNNYALKLTIAQYLTAGKYSIQTVGVTPDIILTAAVIDKDHIDIFPNKPSTEMELEKHLEQIIPLADKEKKEISFFKPYINEEEFEELRRREYSNQLDFKDDFGVKLATRMILATTSPKPKEMLKESNQVVKKLEQQEEEKISAKLSELGTNWGPGSEKIPLKLQVTSSIKQNKKTVARATAGEKIKLVLAATNRGNKEVNKLIGVIEAENPLLDEKEFVFGNLKPGETASREVSFELPPGLDNRNIPYKVNFKLGDTSTKFEYSSDLKVSGLKRPSFSFSYQLEKPRSVGAPHPLPIGKSVPLTVKVKNIGNGPTKDASVYISNKKNIKGLFIEKGRVNLGVIKPGATKKASFAFRVQPSIESSAFIIELTISDRELLEFLSTDLEITTESGSMKPKAGIWYEAPKIELAVKSFPITSQVDQYTLSGKIIDDVAIKDYFIFVGDEKAAYHSNPHETNEMNIHDKLKLKKGNNNVTIIARDNNSMATRKSLVIQRGKF